MKVDFHGPRPPLHLRLCAAGVTRGLPLLPPSASRARHASAADRPPGRELGRGERKDHPLPSFPPPRFSCCLPLPPAPEAPRPAGTPPRPNTHTQPTIAGAAPFHGAGNTLRAEGVRRRWDPKSRVWGADQLILALDLYHRPVPCCMVTGKQRSAWGRDVETARTLLQPRLQSVWGQRRSRRPGVLVDQPSAGNSALEDVSLKQEPLIRV